MKDNEKLPLIFVLDLDGTIIGESILQVCRYDVCRTIAHKPDQNAIKCEIEGGLVRPHFKTFLKSIKEHYPNAEFFVYTAAEIHWATTMITAVEKYLQIKFNRPIFARTSCYVEEGFIKKSLHKIAPVIYKKLKKKYHLQNIESIQKQMMLIDNTNVIGPIDVNRFVKCPSYSYFTPCDALGNIQQTKLQAHLPSIVSVLKRYNILSNPKDITTPYHLYTQYYSNLSEYYKTAASLSNVQKKDEDKFWLIMQRIFISHNIRSFNKKVVDYITKKVNS